MKDLLDISPGSKLDRRGGYWISAKGIASGRSGTPHS